MTLNRPEPANALNAVLRAELVASLSALVLTESQIKLAGGGPHFCAGRDLRDLAQRRIPSWRI